MNLGYVKLHRAIADHPRSSDPEWLSVWVRLLLLATHKAMDFMFCGSRRTLNPGQLITSRDSLSKQCGVNASKVERVLTWMENEQQIEQESSKTSRLITIVNWSLYQGSEQPIEQLSNSYRTASEQLANTNKNVRRKECKNNGELSLLVSVPDSGQFANEIYDCYPKKAARPVAIRAILKALKQRDSQFLRERTKLFAEMVQRGEVQFVCHPATWFNAERYNDDPETWKNGIAAAALTKTPTTFDIRTALANKEKEAEAFKRKHFREHQGISGGQYVPAGWDSEQSKAEHAKLKAEVQALKEKFNQMAA